MIVLFVAYRRLRRPAQLALTLFLLPAAACFSDSGGGEQVSDGDCPEGEADCACFPNDTCLGALECIRGRCVDEDAGTTTGAADDEDGESTMDDNSTGDDESGMDDSGVELDSAGETEGDGECAGMPAGMVCVPEGEFSRGCASVDGGCYADENPLTAVDLSPFAIDMFEVTQAQYRECVNASACDVPGTATGCHWPAAEWDDHPVNCVDYDRAQSYCAFAGKRLATEAEWQKAARGSDDDRVYPWGDPVPDCTRAVMMHMGEAGCGDSSTGVPGSKPEGVSVYGVEDMSGNVAEWVSDWYAADYYVAGPSVDPPGPDSGDNRIYKGGSFSDVDLRISLRTNAPPDTALPQLGIRCAWSPGR